MSWLDHDIGGKHVMEPTIIASSKSLAQGLHRFPRDFLLFIIFIGHGTTLGPHDQRGGKSSPAEAAHHRASR